MTLSVFMHTDLPLILKEIYHVDVTKCSSACTFHSSTLGMKIQSKITLIWLSSERNNSILNQIKKFDSNFDKKNVFESKSEQNQILLKISQSNLTPTLNLLNLTLRLLLRPAFLVYFIQIFTSY